MEDYQRKLHLNISYFNFLTIDWFCNRQPSISLPASNRLEIANINWYLHACIYRLSKNLWDSYLNEKNLGFVYKTCTLFVTEIAQNIFCIKSDVIKHKIAWCFTVFPFSFFSISNPWELMAMAKELYLFQSVFFEPTAVKEQNIQELIPYIRFFYACYKICENRENL